MKLKITLLALLSAFFGFSQNLNSGLLLDYAFNGNTNDRSGNANHGQAFQITYRPDREGNANSAAYFNGVNAYVNFPNVSTLKVPLPVSFSFWVKYANATNYQTQTVFNTSFESNRSTGVWFNATSSGNRYAVNFGDGSYDYTEDTRNTYVSTAAIDSDEWHQVVVIVRSASNMKIYIDCEDQGGNYSGYGAGLVYSLMPGCIGRHDRSLTQAENYFQGSIDDFRYWNRALTVNEVNVLCNQGALAVADVTMSKDQKFVVFPNPADSYIAIKTSLEGEKNISIYNALGKQVYAGAYTETIDTSNFGSGIYFIKLNSEHETETQKIIIK